MKKSVGKHSTKINSIQTKLILTMALALGVVLIVNLFIFNQIRYMVREIDTVFASNVMTVDLKEKLNQVQDSAYDYLMTKSSAALEDYYRYEQDYREMIRNLNDVNTDNSMKALEKNIRNMSETFLDKTAQAVSAKRGRNVERYKALYDEETQLYRYINSYIYELSNQQFQQNSRNYQALLSSMNVLEIFGFGVFAVAFVAGMATITMRTRVMIRPLKQLSIAADKVAAGDFDVEIPEHSGKDEISVVANAFGQMVDSIQEYIEHIRTSLVKEAQMKERELLVEARLKDAQLKYLRAQMNPHFLFNSLNAGIQLAMMEDAEQTGVFLEKMAEFFRYDVKMDEETTLMDEIQAVDNYIYILNVRFAGDIIFEKEIELDGEELSQIRMPSMILQPIVENAVQHGIREKMGEGIIRLIVEKEGKEIHIVVMDNGEGMTSEQIDAVLSGQGKPDGDDNDSNGIALDNVIHRLKLYYDVEQVLTIESEGPGEGTVVTIMLPQKEGGRPDV